MNSNFYSHTLAITHSEFVKTVKAPSFWPLILAPVIPVLVISLFIYIMSYDEFLVRIQSTNNDPDPYNYLWKWFGIFFNFFLMPYYAIFLVWFFEIERKANAWKYLNCLPLKFSTIFFSKVATAMTLVAFIQMVTAVSLLIAGLVLKLSKPDWPFDQYPMFSVSSISVTFFSIYILSMPAFIIFFLLIQRFDNPGLFIVLAIVVGLLGFSLNPFHFHGHGLILYQDLRAGKPLDFDFLYVASMLCILMLAILRMYSVNLQRILFKL